MGSGVSMVIAGNCQAQPLADALRVLCPAVTAAEVITVHLTQDENEAHWRPLLDAADIILTQPIKSSYPCRFVRTEALRAAYGDRVCAYTNVYFEGYFPELCWLRSRQAKRLRGPLGPYHNEIFFETWKEGGACALALERRASLEYNQTRYGEAGARSMAELASREAECELRIVDWMQEQLWRERLFFTFNHPSKRLIGEMALRVAKRFGLAHSPIEAYLSHGDEPLDIVRSPINPWVAHNFAPQFAADDLYQGFRMSNAQAAQGTPRTYTAQELAVRAFRWYDEAQPIGRSA